MVAQKSVLRNTREIEKPYIVGTALTLSLVWFMLHGQLFLISSIIAMLFSLEGANEADLDTQPLKQ